ncbi:hypothetical protein ACOSQ4_010301 [Xanthoceras sorbifolium]
MVLLGYVFLDLQGCLISVFYALICSPNYSTFFLLFSPKFWCVLCCSREKEKCCFLLFLKGTSFIFLVAPFFNAYYICVRSCCIQMSFLCLIDTERLVCSPFVNITGILVIL